MVDALIVEPEAELTIMAVPAPMMAMPQDAREQFGFWRVIESIQMQDNVIPMGPPTELRWTFCSEPGDVDRVVLDHPCEDCQDGLARARKALVDGEAATVAVVQFTQHYLRNIRDLVGDNHREVFKRG